MLRLALNEAGGELEGVMLARGQEVIRAERDALYALESMLNGEFVAACEAIAATRRQLVITGMGKSGHIARKVAATFAATGTPAIYIHPSEAGHGDLGIIAEGDVLMVLSNSGNTAELRWILGFAKVKGIPIIGVASRANSLVIQMAEIPLLLPQVREACSENIAPTTSTTMQLALGDALALTVMDMRGITREYLRTLHPSGSIGLSLTPVSDLMHGAERMPLVNQDAGMPETISVMTSGSHGIAGVTDRNGALVGIITDGDLRRRFSLLETALARDIMTANPKTIAPAMPAGEALTFLSDSKITAAFVVEDPAAGPQPPLGIIHIHDLLRHGLG